MAHTNTNTDETVFIPRYTRADRRLSRHRDIRAWKDEFASYMDSYMEFGETQD